MGSLQAREMAELMEIDSALAWHLRANHYPPVPVSMVEPCKEAIQAFLEGDYLRKIELPNPVKYHGSSFAPADAIVEQHHLDAWVELDEEGLE
jgi:hypothetical protein